MNFTAYVNEGDTVVIAYAKDAFDSGDDSVAIYNIQFTPDY